MSGSHYTDNDSMLIISRMDNTVFDGVEQEHLHFKEFYAQGPR